MQTIVRNGKKYKLPNELNSFQEEMYIHLIDWKRNHITEEVGYSRYRGEQIQYDAILPESVWQEYPLIYPDIKDIFKSHGEKYPFRQHKYFNHMASSQAANVNLFLPILLSDKADLIFSRIKTDFKNLATGQLDRGFRIEFWDESFNNLNDKNKASGTDTDIAIAYYNNQDELCLWLIEHKLSEREFTSCGGYKSKGRRSDHDCSKNFNEIIANKDVCYYHSKRKYKYWEITEKNRAFFVNHREYDDCPFKGAMNQLWRNQLLGLSIEQDDRQPYKNVYFSVVHHPGNTSLNRTIEKYRNLTDGNERFSTFTSKEVVDIAESLNDDGLNRWVECYRGLYKV